jgi:hypothetical protein
MMYSDPLPDRTFVQADGMLAEFICHAHLHRFHRPDECIVHLEVASMLLIESGD